MDAKLKEVIRASSFQVVTGDFVYAKVKTRPVDKHFLVTEDESEITVVTKEEQLSELDLIERNKEIYTLVMLNVSVPFYAVGFLAAISSVIAEQGMNILIISTYSKDYILIKKESAEKAQWALHNLGLTPLYV